ncbi:hypothetical protein JS533_009815 [Bifidobacterium amazonense]|uniref:Uncharacterized protein n=1 Tax=Bifidobacterium amazonense TaxID=2809027 RepID=A0ABS9VWR7_9BIFI|nr:hypothetical protein [Bifidobacterium amazonense]MCH9276558.1 hypothetical protein [Bifidobacterium amazonense]
MDGRISRLVLPVGAFALRAVCAQSYRDAEPQMERGADGKPSSTQKLVDGKPVYPLRGLIVQTQNEKGEWVVAEGVSVKARVAKDWPLYVPLAPAGEKVIVTPYATVSGKYASVRYSVIVDDLQPVQNK